MKITQTGVMINSFDMKLLVYRYRYGSDKAANHTYMPPYYATLEYIEHLIGANAIEDQNIEVDESDLDSLGRIEIDEKVNSRPHTD